MAMCVMAFVGVLEPRRAAKLNLSQPAAYSNIFVSDPLTWRNGYLRGNRQFMVLWCRATRFRQVRHMRSRASWPRRAALRTAFSFNG